MKCIFLSLVFLIVIAVAECGSGEQREKRMVDAIEKSRSELPVFIEHFENRLRAQEKFRILYLERGEGGVVLKAMAVKDIDRGTFRGKQMYTDEMLTCDRTQIVDWRFVDSHELIGGYLFKHLDLQLQGRPKFDVRDVCPFLIEREKESFGNVASFRCIANGQKQAVKKWISSIDPVDTFEVMPLRVNPGDPGREIYEQRFNAVGFAAAIAGVPR